MKILAIAFLLCTVTLLSSCDKDDNSRNDELDGTWQLVSIEGTGSSEFAIENGISLPVQFSMNGCELDYIVSFDEAASKFNTTGTYAIKYDSAVMNDSTVHTVAHDDYQVSSNYVEVGDELSSDKAVIQFMIPSAIGQQTIDIQNATVVQLADEDLILRQVETFTEQKPEGFLQTTVDVTTTWKKK